MKTCHECGEQLRNGSSARCCKPCYVMYDAVAVWARNMVMRAVNRGDLHRLSAANVACADCGERATRYDHRDYLKPLDVVPVCHRCNVKRGPAIPFLSRITDPALEALCAAARERRESRRLRSFGARP